MPSTNLIILQPPRRFTYTAYTQPAEQAVYVGDAAEVAALITIAANTSAGLQLAFQTAAQPFEEEFVEMAGASWSLGASETGSKILYLETTAQFLRFVYTSTSVTRLEARITLEPKAKTAP